MLTAAQLRHAAAVKAEIDKLQLAVEWAALNPGEPFDETRSWEERELEIAGDGAPTVAEFSIAEFALAVGMSTDAGRVYIGDAVELAHRLPRTWGRVLAGEVAVWKARKVAQQTKSLPVDAAAFVDRALAPVLQSCAFAQIDRTVEAAGAEFDPAAAKERRQAGAERPVLDLNENLTTDAHTPTERQQEQAVLTFPHCVFPDCSRRSRFADLDHIEEWPWGSTDTWNLILELATP